MHIQERCLLRWVVGLCLLGGVTFLVEAANLEQPLTNATAATTTTTTTPGAPKGEDTVPTIQPLQTDRREEITELKAEHPTKETDLKAAAEAKKKPVDFKAKTDQKYQKLPKDEEVAKRASNVTMSTILKPGMTTLPFLLHGEPIIMDPVPTEEPAKVESSSAIAVTSATLPAKDEAASSRGRALNVSAPEPTNSLHANLTDLSDVSMDDDDKEVEGGEYVVTHNETSPTSGTMTATLLPRVEACVEGNRTYAVGDKVLRDCEEKCVCSADGQITNCEPLCVSPYVRRGRVVPDPMCEERMTPEEPCCAVVVCATDPAPETEEPCVFRNKTVSRGQRVEDGCSRTCICEAGGKLECQPRCPPNESIAASQHDRCVALPDPRDHCCTIILCDVTLGDHEIKPESSTELTVDPTDAKVLNSTAIKLLKLPVKNPQDLMVELSEDNRVWKQRKPDKDGIISHLMPARTYYMRLTEAGRIGPSIRISLPAEVIKTNVSDKVFNKKGCSHRGKYYELGAEWYDECISFCVCAEPGKPECVTIECPTDFGLDVLDPHCLDWETVPPNFVPKPPQCCPEELRCRNNGSCSYAGHTFDNWSELPSNITGCEKRCYCEMGNVSCQAACPPVPALPPPSPDCPAHQVTLARIPGDECCLHWVCTGSSGGHGSGTNATHAFPGPLSTESTFLDRQTIDDRKRPANGSEMLRPSQEPGRAGASSIKEDPKTVSPTDPDVNYDSSNRRFPFHYPMDPGHPTVPYNGPYSPDYKPGPPTPEEIFHLGPPSAPIATSTLTSKEKPKPKSDLKKPVESQKQRKDPNDRYFPGPLAPEILVDSSLSTSPHSYPAPVSVAPPRAPISPNELSPFERPQFPGLDQHHDFALGPQPNPAANDPNLPVASKKKPLAPAGHSVQPPTKQQQLLQQILPDELHHLINLDHPDFPVRVEQRPFDGPHSNPLSILTATNDNRRVPLIGQNAATYVHSNESGHITYHIHTPDIPTTPKQIEELLAQIARHDPNPGPFQRYPGQPGPLASVPHSVIPAAVVHTHARPHARPHAQPPPPPPHSSGLVHSMNPYASSHALDHSGMDHDLPPPPGFSLPGGLPGYGLGIPSDEVIVQILEALDEHTVRLAFTVPQVLVGLHGRVELRYTSDKTNYDPSTWKVQIFAPPGDLIATPQLEFELGDLKPSTEYKVKITVKLKDLVNSPTSKVYSVRTLEKRAETPTLPPQIPIDAELKGIRTNSSWIDVTWKKFTEYELQFIDGIQLRYKEHDGKVYSTTPLIHRAITNYVIENLKPSTTYDLGIYFIPFAGHTTELVSDNTIQVTTATEPDPYSFEVKVEIKSIKATDVEVSWSGVPYPEDKYVNIYRAIYQTDSGKGDASTFKIAKRDSPAKTVISDLKPGTRYRLWIEIYLTNGRIKKSNVQDFVTKPGGPSQASISQQTGKLASLTIHEGDYYGPLVIVAIVASLAILSTLILLMMLMKRRISSKADISPRKTTSAYDNPSYKTCEETAAIPNGRSKISEHEMATISIDAKINT